MSTRLPVPALTAGNAEPWEAGLLARAGDERLGVEVVARCLDVVDLLATAQVGRARVAVVAADLRHLDREVVARLHALGLAVVAVTDAPFAAPRTREIGVDAIVEGPATPERIGQEVARALCPTPARIDGEREGRIVAVWGPSGAPGRSTVALAVADEAAAAGVPVLLVDADPYGGSLAPQLGLLDESPGVLAAVRAAAHGTLDVTSLLDCAVTVAPRLALLGGLTRAGRWPDLRDAAFGAVLEAARRACALVVVDVGFCLEADEELSHDLPAPRRNGATLTALAAADAVVAIVVADPIGVQRFVRVLPDLRAVVRPDAELPVVVNKLRDGAVGGRDAGVEVSEVLARHAGVEPAALLPFDVDACDRALAAGRALREVAPGSPLSAALRTLAHAVARVPAPPARRRRLVRP